MKGVLLAKVYAYISTMCPLAKSETAEKGNTKEAGPQKERHGTAQKSEQKIPEPSKRDQQQRGKGSFTQGRMDRHSGSDKT